MNIRLLGCLLLATCMMGCASTSRQPTSLSNLQIKVSHLEKLVESRDREVSTLKYEMTELSSQVESLETFQLGGTIEAYDAKETFMLQETKRLAPIKTSKKSEGILRVSASSKEIQEALKSAGYYNGKIDGKLGAQSKKAVKEFQEDHDLKVDGVIGKKTWSEMKLYLK